MLKTNELRIGNRIIYAGKEIIVEGIVGNTIHHSKSQFDQNIAPTYEPFRPIQLNEEWFLKAGFSFNSELNLEKYPFEIQKSNVNANTYLLYIKGSYGIKIKYVHDFQNAMFVFRGEELVFSTEP